MKEKLTYIWNWWYNVTPDPLIHLNGLTTSLVLCWVVYMLFVISGSWNDELKYSTFDETTQSLRELGLMWVFFTVCGVFFWLGAPLVIPAMFVAGVSISVSFLGNTLALRQRNH